MICLFLFSCLCGIKSNRIGSDLIGTLYWFLEVAFSRGICGLSCLCFHFTYSENRSIFILKQTNLIFSMLSCQLPTNENQSNTINFFCVLFAFIQSTAAEAGQKKMLSINAVDQQEKSYFFPFCFPLSLVSCYISYICTGFQWKSSQSPITFS